MSFLKFIPWARLANVVIPYKTIQYFSNFCDTVHSIQAHPNGVDSWLIRSLYVNYGIAVVHQVWLYFHFAPDQWTMLATFNYFNYYRITPDIMLQSLVFVPLSIVTYDGMYFRMIKVKFIERIIGLFLYKKYREFIFYTPNRITEQTLQLMNMSQMGTVAFGKDD